jgi:hypothetical protein
MKLLLLVDADDDRINVQLVARIEGKESYCWRCGFNPVDDAGDICEPCRSQLGQLRKVR